MGADMELPSREQESQLLVEGSASEPAETTASPWAATVGLSRPSMTGPELVNPEGKSAFAPWPTEPTVKRLFAMAGVPTMIGGEHVEIPAFPAADTTRRSGYVHMARSASRAYESYGIVHPGMQLPSAS